jgi:flagellar basal body-associated protein FliL
MIQVPVDLRAILTTGLGGLMAWLLKKVTTANTNQAKFKEDTGKQLAIIETNLTNLVARLDRDHKPT